MQRGLILAIEKKYVILLVPKEGFVKGEKIAGAKVGEEVYFKPYEEKRFSFQRVTLGTISALFQRKWSYVLLVMLFAFSGALLMPINRTEASTYVSLECSASIEFELDKQLNVVDIVGYGEESESMLKSLEAYKGHKINKLMEQIVKIEKEKGIIDKNYHSHIVVTKTDTATKEELKQINELLKDISKKEGYAIRYHEQSEELRLEALKKGLSPCKYFTLLTIKENGLNINEKDMQTLNINNHDSNLEDCHEHNGEEHHEE